MKYNMNKYFAYTGLVGIFIFWLFLKLNSIELFTGDVILTAIVCVAILMCVFAIFRSYIVLEPKQIVIYAGLVKKVVLYENIEYMKETSSIFLMSRSMCYAIHNLGIKVKGPNFNGRDYLLVSVQDLDDFIKEIEVTQPSIKVIRKDA